MRKLQSGRYFSSIRPEVLFGLHRSDAGNFYHISDIQPAVATDEYGDEDSGFSFEAELATEEEIQEWQEARQEARAGRSVWDMMEEYTTER